jgi:hypothetical protein
MTPNTRAVTALTAAKLVSTTGGVTSSFTLRTRPDLRPQVMTSVVATENTAAFAAYAAGGILIAAAGTTATLLLAATTATGCAIALLLAVAALPRPDPHPAEMPTPSLTLRPARTE